MKPDIADMNPEESVTMWKCPECKIVNLLEDQYCQTCHRQLQFFENIKGIDIESMLVEEPMSTYEKQRQDRGDNSGVLWTCPKDERRVLTSDECPVCNLDIKHYADTYDSLTLSPPQE